MKQDEVRWLPDNFTKLILSCGHETVNLVKWWKRDSSHLSLSHTFYELAKTITLLIPSPLLIKVTPFLTGFLWLIKVIIISFWSMFLMIIVIHYTFCITPEVYRFTLVSFFTDRKNNVILRLVTFLNIFPTWQRYSTRSSQVNLFGSFFFFKILFKFEFKCLISNQFSKINFRIFCSWVLQVSVVNEISQVSTFVISLRCVMLYMLITLYATTPQNGWTHSNNSSAKTDEFFKCVWPFCGVGA